MKKAEVIEEKKVIVNERGKFYETLIAEGYDVEDMGYPSVLCNKEEMGDTFDRVMELAKKSDYRGTYGVRARKETA